MHSPCSGLLKAQIWPHLYEGHWTSPTAARMATQRILSLSLQCRETAGVLCQLGDSGICSPSQQALLQAPTDRHTVFHLHRCLVMSNQQPCVIKSFPVYGHPLQGFPGRADPTPGGSGRQEGLACSGSWGHEESDTTKRRLRRGFPFSSFGNALGLRCSWPKATQEAGFSPRRDSQERNPQPLALQAET